VGNITQDAIDKLSLVANLCNHIHVKNGGEEEDGLAFSRFFPPFLWVLRDVVSNISLLAMAWRASCIYLTLSCCGDVVVVS
jgi:hypothetical protein